MKNYLMCMMGMLILAGYSGMCGAVPQDEQRINMKERFRATEKLYRKSLKKMQKGRWQQAEEMLERIMTEYPSFKEISEESDIAIMGEEDTHISELFPLRYSLVLTKYKQGKYQEAMELLAGLDDPQSLYLNARCLEADGEFLKAITRYRKILEKTSDIPKEILEYRIALNFLMSNNAFSAEDLFRDFIAAHPKSMLIPNAQYHLGSAAFINKKYASAEDIFKKLLASNVSLEMNTRCNFMLGECKFYLTDYIFAEEHYLDVILSEQNNNPWIAQAFYRRTWCAYKLRNVSDFINLSNKFKKQFPGHPLLRPMLYLIGYSFAEEKELKEAVTIFRNIVTQEEYDTLWDAALNQMAACYIALDDMGSIITICQHLLQKAEGAKTPWKPGILLYLGEAYYRQGFIDKAEEIYRQILTEYPLNDETIEATRGLAWCAYQKKDDDGSKEVFHTLAFPKDKSRVPETTQAEAFWQIGNCLSNQGEYAEAVALYDTVITNYPDTPFAEQAVYQKGSALYNSEYYSLAVRTWEKLISGSAKTGIAKEAHVRIASTYFLLQDFKKAGETYLKILEEYPDLTSKEDVSLGLAQSYYNSGAYKEAVGIYAEFIRTYPDSLRKTDAEKGVQMAEYMYAVETNEPDRLAEFVRHNPNAGMAADALLRIGQIHYEKKDFEKAILALQNVFTSYPESESAITSYYMIARIYQQQKNFVMEEQIERNFVSNYPHSELLPEITFNLGITLCNQEKFSEAIEVFKTVFTYKEQQEFHAAAQYNLALCYKKLQQWDNATTAYREMVNAYPAFNNIDAARTDLAMLLTEQDMHAEAIAIYQKLIQTTSGENKLEIMYKLAECYVNTDNTADAKRVFQKILARNPRKSPWRLAGMVKLGEMYEKDKNWAGAIDVYKEIALISGTNSIGRAAKSKLEILVKLKNNTGNQ
ncbi:MAG: tetratricopeptide repeat protein [bacterium]